MYMFPAEHDAARWIVGHAVAHGNKNPVLKRFLRGGQISRELIEELPALVASDPALKGLQEYVDKRLSPPSTASRRYW